MRFVFILKTARSGMPAPEEVDEIDTYLHLRKQRQERGELPKADYTPPFIKKFGQAILGKKSIPKPALQSMQPTYVSTEAQAAMRRQIEEVMNERAPKNPALNQAPRVPSAKNESGSTPPVLSLSRDSIPSRANTPILPVSQSGMTVDRPFSTVKPTAFEKNSTPAVKPPSTMWERFHSWMKSKPAAPESVLPPAPSIAGRAPEKPMLQPVVPLGSVARQPGYVPIGPVNEVNPVYLERESHSDARDEISPVKLTLSPVADVPPFEKETPRSTPPAPAESVRSMNAPPWVRRTAAAGTVPGSIADVAAKGTVENLPWISAKEAARQQSYQRYLENKKNSGISPTGAIAASMKSAGVKMPLLPHSSFQTPRPVNESAASSSAYSVATEKKNPLPARLKPWVSGEVNLDEDEKKSAWEKKEEELSRIPPISPLAAVPSTPPRPAADSTPLPHATESAREEEISEEEALEQLPFDEVEGLTDSDLDYLERKEREHRVQEAKKDPDYVASDELKDRLQQQSARMTAVLPTVPPEMTPVLTPAEEKEAILRRLKKMMEESGSPPSNLPKS